MGVSPLARLTIQPLEPAASRKLPLHHREGIARSAPEVLDAAPDVVARVRGLHQEPLLVEAGGRAHGRNDSLLCEPASRRGRCARAVLLFGAVEERAESEGATPGFGLRRNVQPLARGARSRCNGRMQIEKPVPLSPSPYFWPSPPPPCARRGRSACTGPSLSSRKYWWAEAGNFFPCMRERFRRGVLGNGSKTLDRGCGSSAVFKQACATARGHSSGSKE